jgi:iron complex outermembrane recepter protein
MSKIDRFDPGSRTQLGVQRSRILRTRLDYTRQCSANGSPAIARNLAPGGPRAPLIGATLALLGCASAFGADETSSDASEHQALEEIVVTATKRAQTVQEVPAMVSAISDQQIAQQGITQFADYLAVVPALSQSGSGAPGQGQVIIRGLTSGNNQSASTVGFVIDDIPFTPNSPSGDSSLVTADPDIFDVERLEVLEGPQGTLYGANALGGLIRIVSKQPDLDSFSAAVKGDWVSVDHGGSDGTVHGMVNIPLVNDVVALRISAFDRTDPGFMRDVDTGRTDTNTTHASGGKAFLKIAPTSDLSIVFSGWTQDMHTDAAAQVYTDPTTLQPIYCRYCYNGALNYSFDSQYRLGGMTVNWTSPFGTLTNVLGYGKYTDYSYTQALDFAPLNAAFAPLGLPVDSVPLVTLAVPMEKLTDELRFVTTRMGNFEGLGGLYFTHETSQYIVSLSEREPLTLAPLSPPAFALFNNMLNLDTRPLYKEYAAFTNLTYYFLPNLDATAGGRISHDQQNADTYSDGFLIGPATQSHFGSNENPVTYLANLRYRPQENVDTYIRYATGYRPGGPQQNALPGYPTTFGPDSTDNYEVGVKTRWLDGQLTANLVAYYTIWKDIQLNYNVAVGGNSFTLTGNGGRATTRGLEFQGAYTPIRGLTTQLSLSYGHAYLDVNVPSLGAQVGDTLPFAPRITAALMADYSFPVGAGLNGDVGATYGYQGARFTSFPGYQLDPNFELPGYGTLNLRAGLNWTRYSVELRLNNATDKYAYTASNTQLNSPGQQGVPASSVVLTPRTLILELSAKFN